jgi:hypothetical protein
MADVAGLMTDEDNETYCPVCGEPCDHANVEAFELTGEAMCDDCAEQAFEDNDQFGVGA